MLAVHVCILRLAGVVVVVMGGGGGPKLPGNEKESVSGIITTILPSPGAELDSHLTERSRRESCVCVYLPVYVCVCVGQSACSCTCLFSTLKCTCVGCGFIQGRKAGVVFKAQH